MTAGEGVTGAFSLVDVWEHANVIYTPNSVILSMQRIGDLDGDHMIGMYDLDLVLGLWNQHVPAGSWAHGDPSGDGFVGLADLDIVLNHWNTGTPPAVEWFSAVPEPGTFVVLGVCGAAVSRRQGGV